MLPASSLRKTEGILTTQLDIHVTNPRFVSRPDIQLELQTKPKYPMQTFHLGKHPNPEYPEAEGWISQALLQQD